jgi:uncharacterized membrane protein
MRWLFPIAVGLVLAGLVHIATLLALPTLAPKNIYARLAQLGPDDAFHIVPVTAEGKPLLPFLDPAFLHAICRYDLSDGPLQLHVPVSTTYASLSLYDADGLPFFAINERSATEGALELIVQEEPADEDDDQDESDQTTTVAAPQSRGFAVLRALVPAPDRIGEIRELFENASCTPVPAS